MIDGVARRAGHRRVRPPRPCAPALRSRDAIGLADVDELAGRDHGDDARPQGLLSHRPERCRRGGPAQARRDRSSPAAAAGAAEINSHAFGSGSTPSATRRNAASIMRRIVVVRGEDRAEAFAHHVGRADPAGVAAATHDIRRAEHDELAGGSRLARGRPRSPGIRRCCTPSARNSCALRRRLVVMRQHRHAVGDCSRRQGERSSRHLVGAAGDRARPDGRTALERQAGALGHARALLRAWSGFSTVSDMWSLKASRSIRFALIQPMMVSSASRLNVSCRR